MPGSDPELTAELARELTAFVRRYELAGNSHVTSEVAVRTYGFRWQGRIDGEPAAGSGRGTNVVTRRDGVWKMLHEHLSS